MVKSTFHRLAVPASLVVGSLGLSFTSAAASISSAPTVAASAMAPVTIAGTVVKVQISQYVFWLAVGNKIYKVRYSPSSFVRGSAAALAKEVSVSVRGSFVGRSSTIVRAAGISV